MFTRKRLPLFQPTGNWGVDGPQLYKWLHDYFLSLEQPGALSITEATIDSSSVGDDEASTGHFSILLADALAVEGTSWTPVITAATAGDLAVGYSVQLGEHHQIGRLEIAHFRLTTSSFTHTTASGDLQITGLSTSAATLANFAWIGGGLEFSGITKATYTQFTPRVSSADNKIIIRASGSGVAVANTAITDLPTGGTVVLNGTLIYRR